MLDKLWESSLVLTNERSASYRYADVISFPSRLNTREQQPSSAGADGTQASSLAPFM
jgi:hypothetical protein